MHYDSQFFDPLGALIWEISTQGLRGWTVIRKLLRLIIYLDFKIKHSLFQAFCNVS